METARSRRGDRGDIVLGWLTRLVVVLAVLGVVAFDLIALAVGRLQAEDRAAVAARAAASTWQSTQNVQSAYDAALARLAEQSGSAVHAIDPSSFTVGADGAVTLTLRSTTATLVVERIGPARSWATSTVTTTARPV